MNPLFPLPISHAVSSLPAFFTPSPSRHRGVWTWSNKKTTQYGSTQAIFSDHFVTASSRDLVVWVQLGCYKALIIDQVACKQQKFISHGSGDLEFKIQEQADSVCRDGPLPHRRCLLSVFSCEWREEGTLRELVPFIRASPPNTITLGGLWI